MRNIIEKCYESMLRQFIDRDNINITGKEDTIIAHIAGDCCDIYAEETFSLIQKLFEQGKIDLSYINEEDFAHYSRFKNKDTVLKHLEQNEYYHLITDAETETQNWGCITEN